MKKSVIALAVAAALPVAAQADVTLSGSVTAVYSSTDSALDVDSDLDISSTEVLANGMIATASFDVNTADNTQGEAGLSGDFGALTVGSALDSDSAFQAGDIGDVIVDTTTGASSTAATTNAIHYSGDFAGLSVQAQLNAASDAIGTAGTSTKGTQASINYDLNGATLGYGYASADADADTASASGTTANNGVTQKLSVFGASYSFGDLTISAGKTNLVGSDAVLSATYKTTVDALTVEATITDKGVSNTHELILGYDLSGIALAVTEEKDKKSAASAAFTSGDLTVTVARVNDGSNDVTAALDLGNADITLERDGSKSKTTATYKVSF